MAALVVLAFGGSAWIWDNLSSDDSVNVILVLISGSAAALLVVLRICQVARSRTSAMPIGLLSVVAAIAGVCLAFRARRPRPR